MAKLAELGRQYPCTTQGVEIPVDDPGDIYAGDVLEAWFEADRDINVDTAFAVLVEVLRMKEEYPHFVLHYVKVETRKITVQYSIAPMKTTGNSPLSLVLWIVIAFFVGLIAYTGLNLYWTRGYLVRPTGTAVINAVHTETKKGISGVAIYVDGNYVGRTDGGSVSVKRLVVGPHEFNGEPLEDYHVPMPVTKEIELNKISNVDIYYRPSDIPEPKTGWLDVYTTPVTGVVSADGVERGPAPIELELSIGDHTVGFGPVEGYIAPAPQTATIVGGQRTPITGEYLVPGAEEAWYAKLAKYGLIGGGIIIGTVLVVPPVIRAIREKK